MSKRCVLVIAVVMVAACKGKTATPAAAPAGDAGDKVGGQDQAEKMRHCPVTVPGVKTELEDVAGGVRFELQADDAKVVEEARRRSHALAEFVEGRAQGQHGGGRGGGFMRNCPIPSKDVRLGVEEVEGGVRITVTAVDAAKVDELRARARARLARAPLERANVVREETSENGETRLFSGEVADLDGDGSLELVAAGFSALAEGRRSTILVYRQDGASWAPLSEAGWDGGNGSTARNVEIADVDGDGKPDVVALGRVGASPHEAKARLAVFHLVDGKLVQRAEMEWLDGTYTHGYGLALADLDGAGGAEIVTGGFQFDGTREDGFVRVWSMKAGALALRARVVLDGDGLPSMRVNDLAVGDLDGDGHAEIVVAGRHGALKSAELRAHHELRREVGDLTVLSFDEKALRVRTRFTWAKASSLRLRTLVVADLDGDGKDEVVAGGQYDAEGRACLGLFAYQGGQLVLRDDASSIDSGVTGEVKDLIVAGPAKDLRVLATGVAGDAPGRHGDLAAWRLDKGKLVADVSLVSRNADETRARAAVVVPGKGGSSVLTIGHARNDKTMSGQLLEWQLGTSAQ